MRCCVCWHEVDEFRGYGVDNAGNALCEHCWWCRLKELFAQGLRWSGAFYWRLGSRRYVEAGQFREDGDGFVVCSSPPVGSDGVARNQATRGPGGVTTDDVPFPS